MCVCVMCICICITCLFLGMFGILVGWGFKENPLLEYIGDGQPMDVRIRPLRIKTQIQNLSKDIYVGNWLYFHQL